MLLYQMVRDVAFTMNLAEEIVILQKGVVVQADKLSDIKGPIRLRIAAPAK